MQKVDTALQHLGIHELLGFFQGNDVLVGDFIDDPFQRVRPLNGALLPELGLIPDSQLVGNRLTEIPVARIADVVAQPDNGGGGAKGLLGQGTDAVVQHQFWIRDNLGGHGSFCRT